MQKLKFNLSEQIAVKLLGSSIQICAFAKFPKKPANRLTYKGGPNLYEPLIRME